MRRYIPNGLTLLNLCCGVIAILSDDFYTSCILICCSLFFDLIDGAAARALQVSSDIGKDLDSLADLISFGLAPIMVWFNVLNSDLKYPMLIVPFVASCAALRLARFNNLPASSDFIGMPSPAAGGLILGMALLMHTEGADFLPILTYGVPITAGILMVTNFTMISLKGLRTNRMRQVLLVLTGLAFIIPSFCCRPWVLLSGFGGYILFSLYYHFFAAD